jgi:hypothetical protein
MHINHLPKYNDTLQSCPCRHGTFGNFQRNIWKKFVSVGKLTITQVGTTSLLREYCPFYLTPWTTVCLSSWVPLVVMVCVPHIVTCLKILGILPLDFVLQYSFSNAACSDLQRYDQRRFIEGYLYPEIGWTMCNVSGISPMPPVTYLKQEAPSLLNAWVAVGTSDADLLFGTNVADRGLCVYDGGATTLFESNIMHDVEQQATRLTEIRGFAHGVIELVKQAEDSEKRIDCRNLVIVSHRENTLLDKTITTKAFVKMIEDYSKEIQ